MPVIRSLVKALHLLEDGTLITALATMLALAVLQIILRDFFNQGLLWAESFVRVLVLWVTLLGGMVATRYSGHISIDAVSRYLPERPARVVALLTNLVSAVICGVVAWYSIVFISYEYQDHTIAFANVPSWVCELILPIGFGVMGLRFLIRAGRPLTGREAD